MTKVHGHITQLRVRGSIVQCGGGVNWANYWLTLTSGLIIYRKGVRKDVGKYVIDYSDDGGITWDLGIVILETDEDHIVINIDHGVVGYRHQIRGTVYKIDYALTPLAFAGIENIDWENIYST